MKPRILLTIEQVSPDESYFKVRQTIVVEGQAHATKIYVRGKLTWVGKDSLWYSCDRSLAELLARLIIRDYPDFFAELSITADESEVNQADEWEKVVLPLDAWGAILSGYAEPALNRYAEILERNDDDEIPARPLTHYRSDGLQAPFRPAQQRD